MGSPGNGLLDDALSAVPGLKACGDGSLRFGGVLVAELVRVGGGLLVDVRAHLLDAPALADEYTSCRRLPESAHGEPGWIRASLGPDFRAEETSALREALESARERVCEEREQDADR
jgi:hypothetical protein